MKKLLLPALLLVATHLAYGQKTEVSGHFNSGLFAFRGVSAARTSAINGGGDLVYSPPYTNNPYGTRPGFSYGVAGQVQRVTRGRTLLGAQLGYERLRSRVNLDQVWRPLGSNVSATGHTNLSTNFLNAHPFVGHRFSCHVLDVDVSVGPEVGYLLETVREKGRATDADGNQYAVDNKRSRNRRLDARLRGNVTVFYNQVGVSTGYSYGLTNYREGYVGGTNDLYTHLWRFGLVYRLP